MYNKNQTKRGILLLSIIVMSIWTFFGFTKNENDAYTSERVRIILREVGNKLLLANNDSVSLVMPVKNIATNEYEISFQNELAIDPDFLVQITDSLIMKSNTATDYIIEVINCKTNDVTYSYQVSQVEDNSIIPCSGRLLPTDCYRIRCLFLQQEQSVIAQNIYPIATFAMLLIFISGSFYVYRNKSKESANSSSGHIKLGKCILDFDQQILRYKDNSIRLTSKETELLKIFYQHPNEVIKREQLIKEVWEDHGVFVGRSLDMFISKLRKKLSMDPSIKITNIHGIGYKMEM